MVMEVEIRQGVCNNSPAEWTSPENGWHSSGLPIPDHCCNCAAAMNRRAWRLVMKLLVRTWVKLLLMQILVVVAKIQMRTLKTEVEKGSM